MNILLVGAGGHARSWKESIERHPDWDLVAIVDTDTEKLDHVDQWGVSDDEAYPSITDAVKWSAFDIHCALIATPIPTHHVLAIEALENGISVILEKNMAQTIGQGLALVKVAREHPDLGTAMGTQYRFRPTWWTLKNLFSSGNSPIGDLSHLRMKSTSFSGDLRRGWRAWLPNIYTSDMMVHHVDVLRYVTGMEFIKVQATVFKPNWSRWLGTSSIFMNFVMAPAGSEKDKDTWVYGQYHGDWQAKGLKHAWEDVLEFYGSRGSIRLEPGEEATGERRWGEIWEKHDGIPLIGEPSGLRLVAHVEKKDGKGVERVPIEKQTNIENNGKGYFDQVFILEEMRACIASGGRKQPSTNFSDAFKSFVVTRAANISSETGKSVWLPDYWPATR